MDGTEGTGGWRMTVNGTADSAPVGRGESLVKAGLRAGWRMPHLCLAGECGSCRCRLVTGRVRLRQDISRHVGTAALRQGYLLACQSEALGDVQLDVPGLTPGVAEQTVRSGRIAQLRALSHDIVQLVIELDEPIAYMAGQYAQLTVPGHAALADAPRCYSFSAAPREGPQCRVPFHVRRVAGGLFTEWLFAADRSGERIQLAGPYGDFGFRDDGRPIVCVAGGTGLAPVLAMLEALGTRRSAPDVTLFIAARSQRDLYCQEQLQALQRTWPGTMVVAPVLSQEPADSGWRGLTGYCDRHLGSFCSVPDSSVYLCGPPAMIDATVAAVRQLGGGSHLYYDRFLDRSHLNLP